MLIGNLFLGFAEGLFVSRLLRAPQGRSIALMAGANYFSAFVGVYLLDHLGQIAWPEFYHFTFSHIFHVIGMIYLFLLLITIFLEAPFIYLCPPREARSWIKTFRVSALTQFLSYLLIAPLYVLVSQASISSQWTVKDLAGLSDLKGEVLALDRTRTRWRSLSLSDFKDVKDLEKVEPRENARIYSDLSQTDEIKFFSGGPDLKDVPLQTSIPAKSVSADWFTRFSKQIIDADRVPADPRRNDTCPMWRHFDYADDKNEWQIRRVGFWAVEGITFAKRADANEVLNLAVETPPFIWNVRCATAIPGDRFIFSLGPNLVLANLRTRELTWLGVGRLPLVVLK